MSWKRNRACMIAAVLLSAAATLTFAWSAQGAELQCYGAGRSTAGPPDYWTTGCLPGALIKGVICRESYCGRVNSYCCQYTVPSGSYDYSIEKQYTEDRWLKWISEEKPNNEVTTHDGFAVELSCQGKHCDNLSMRIISHPAFRNTGQCYWTRRFSEEYSGQENCGPSYFLAGMRCFGDYCDNKELYCCKAQLIPIANWKYLYKPPHIPFKHLLPPQ